MHDLESLDLHCTECSIADAAFLTELPRLSRLVLLNTPSAPPNLPPFFARLPALTHLVLSNERCAPPPDTTRHPCCACAWVCVPGGVCVCVSLLPPPAGEIIDRLQCVHFRPASSPVHPLHRTRADWLAGWLAG
jgi:hypothetical protein